MFGRKFDITVAIMLWLSNGGILYLCLISDSTNRATTIMTIFSAFGFLTATAYLWKILSRIEAYGA